MFKRKRGIADDASDFGATLADFMVTLGAMMKSAAEWFGLVSLDAVSGGAEVVSDQAGSFAVASKRQAKKAKKRGRNSLFKLGLVALLVWWLDRDLSRT